MEGSSGLDYTLLWTRTAVDTRAESPFLLYFLNLCHLWCSRTLLLCHAVTKKTKQKNKKQVGLRTKFTSLGQKQIHTSLFKGETLFLVAP